MAKALSGELESSLQDFDDAILLNGGSYAQASKSKGRVLLALRRFSEAHDAYRASIDGLPGDGDAHYGLARVLAEEDNPRALAEARRAKDLTEARELADAEEAAEPQRRAGPYLFFAWALRAWDGDEGERRSALARVIAICERNIEDRRDRPTAKYLLANAQLELGEYSVAAAGFAEAIGLLQRAGAEPDRLYTALAGHGRALTLAERFGEALEACQQAVTLAPSAELRENSLVDRAYVLRRLERVEEAVAVIEEARDSARAGAGCRGRVRRSARPDTGAGASWRRKP